jgi:hypothetical protein
MIFVIGQRGATGWGFQFGKLYGQVNFPRYWFLRGRNMRGERRATFGYIRLGEPV